MARGRSYDVVVIGAGVIGLACAHALQQSGAAVCVVERHLPGSGDSTRTGGGIRLAHGSAINVALTRLSLPTWQNFAALFGVDPQYHNTGHLFLSQRAADSQTAYCGTTCQLDLADVQSGWPRLRHLHFATAHYCETGGYLDHSRVIQGYQETLLRNGVDIRCPVEVDGLLMDAAQQHVHGVRTKQGDFSAALVVNAAGASAARVAALAGLSIPFRARRHELLIVRADMAGPVDTPWLIDVDRQVHLRPDGTGRALMGGFLGRDETVDPEQYARDNDRVWAREVRIAAAKAFGLTDRNCKIITGWAGLYPGTLDYLPVLELSMPGLVTAAGFSGTGLMHAPAIGDIVNSLAQGKNFPQLDVTGLSAQRFKSQTGVAESTGF